MALKSKGIIKFNYHETDFRIKGPLATKAALAAIMAKEDTAFSRIEYIFCTDAYLLELNRRYLDHDTYTDILTFTLSLPEDPVISEIYISVERVMENAQTHKTTFETELHRVMIHGLLHLCGYDDTVPEKKKEMTAREDHYLPLIEVL